MTAAGSTATRDQAAKLSRVWVAQMLFVLDADGNLRLETERTTAM